MTLLLNLRLQAPVLAAASLIALLGGASACGSSDRDAGGQQPSATNYAMEHVHDRGEGALRLRPFANISQALPTTVLERPDGTRESVLTAVVVGTIESVDDGRAFVDGERGSSEVPFSAPEADWRTLHLQVEVAEGISSPRVAKRVTVGLAIGGRTDVARMRSDLAALGRVLLPLTSGGAVFAYDPALLSIAEDGQLLGLVGPDDRIELPALDPEEEERFLAGVDTLNELRAAAAGPPKVIRVDATGQPVEPS